MNGLLGNLFGVQEEDPLLAMLPPEQRARLQAQTRSQGITNLGLALLQAGGPTRTPGGVGAMLGQAGMQAMQANQGLMDANLQRLLASRRLQQEETQRQQMESTLATLSPEDQNLYRLLGPSGFGQVMAKRVEPPKSPFADINPKDYTPESLRLFSQSRNPADLVPRGKEPEPEKFTGPYANLALSLFGTSNITQLTPEQRKQVDDVARQRGLERPASAVVNVGVSTGRKFGEAFAGKVADADAAKLEAAQKVPTTLKTIQSTRQILDSGKVITGFGANQILDVAKLGQQLGVTGSNTNEVIANTEMLFANRAQATLDSIRASGLGTGQGFSNADRDFLEKARLGNIKFTPQALRRQLQIEENIAKATASSWNNRLKDINPDVVKELGLRPVEIGKPSGASRIEVDY